MYTVKLYNPSDKNSEVYTTDHIKYCVFRYHVAQTSYKKRALTIGCCSNMPCSWRSSMEFNRWACKQIFIYQCINLRISAMSTTCPALSIQSGINKSGLFTSHDVLTVGKRVSSNTLGGLARPYSSAEYVESPQVWVGGCCGASGPPHLSEVFKPPKAA